MGWPVSPGRKLEWMTDRKGLFGRQSMVALRGDEPRGLVVVIGGSGNLGSVLVRELVVSGWPTLFVSKSGGEVPRHFLRGADSSGGSYLEGIGGDIRDEATWKRLCAAISTYEQPLQGWVNNAHVGGLGVRLEEIGTEYQGASFDGLQQVVKATTLAARMMVDHGLGGSIVNVASMYGMVAPRPRLYENHEDFHSPPLYGVEKAGIIQFSRYAAAHFGEKSVRVNSVSPGPFPAENVRRSPEFIERLSAQTALQRVGRPEEFAHVVQFLLGSHSSFMTGQNLVVDGGWTL